MRRALDHCNYLFKILVSLPLIFQHNFKKLGNDLEHSRESSKKPPLLYGKKNCLGAPSRNISV